MSTVFSIQYQLRSYITVLYESYSIVMQGKYSILGQIMQYSYVGNNPTHTAQMITCMKLQISKTSQTQGVSQG